MVQGAIQKKMRETREGLQEIEAVLVYMVIQIPYSSKVSSQLQQRRPMHHLYRGMPTYSMQ